MGKPCGEKYTFSDFAENIKYGGLIDYDGLGYFGTDTEESNIKTKPSSFFGQIKLNPGLMKEYTCVWWYNK